MKKLDENMKYHTINGIKYTEEYLQILINNDKNSQHSVLEWIRSCDNPYELDEVWDCLKSRMY